MRNTIAGMLLVCAVAGVLLVPAGSASAGSTPTGDRTFQNGRLDVTYDAADPGRPGFFLEPAGRMHADPSAWAPIYVVVYPKGTSAASTFNCMHFGPNEDNCPSHGDAFAALAAAQEPAVYGGGVAGLDHVLDFPGGDDFNIAWEPVAVLFTSATAANEHLLGDDRILQLRDEGVVKLIPLPAKTFLCAIVPQALWNLGTPVVDG